MLWRASHNVAFATGVGLTTGSIAPLLIWAPLNLILLLGDAWTGQRLIAAPKASRRFYKFAFVGLSVTTISVFIALALYAALYGGDAGRLAAVFLSCGSLVAIATMMVRSPLLLVMSAMPAALLLMCLPALPILNYGPGGAMAAAGVSITMLTFMSHMIRTMFQHVRAVGGLLRAQEIAEARQREAELANRAKTEFLCVVTHELRTPLNAVINYAEIIEEDTTGAIAEDAGRITIAARHLLMMINQILQFSKLETGAPQLKTDEFVIHDLVGEVIETNAPSAKTNNNTLILEPGDNILMRADRERLHECLHCLVDNAIKFTKQGTVTVSWRTEGDHAVISVADTGVGLSEEHMRIIFNPFAQADGSHSRQFEGLGLGLASAQRTIRAMGGHIRVESTLGRGACFDLIVPIEGPGDRRAYMVAPAAPSAVSSAA